MPDENFVEIVEKILRNDLRYPAAAYEFINDSVRFTIRKLQRDTRSRRERHVCGAELIQGVADYAVQEFGPLAWNVLEEWGLVCGSAIGDVVFNMIRSGLLTASENDSREDFNCVPDLRKILPAQKRTAGKKKSGTNPPIIE